MLTFSASINAVICLEKVSAQNPTIPTAVQGGGIIAPVPPPTPPPNNHNQPKNTSFGRTVIPIHSPQQAAPSNSQPPAPNPAPRTVIPNGNQPVYVAPQPTTPAPQQTIKIITIPSTGFVGELPNTGYVAPQNPPNPVLPPKPIPQVVKTNIPPKPIPQQSQNIPQNPPQNLPPPPSNTAVTKSSTKFTDSDIDAINRELAKIQRELDSLDNIKTNPGTSYQEFREVHQQQLDIQSNIATKEKPIEVPPRRPEPTVFRSSAPPPPKPMTTPATPKYEGPKAVFSRPKPVPATPTEIIKSEPVEELMDVKNRMRTPPIKPKIKAAPKPITKPKTALMPKPKASPKPAPAAKKEVKKEAKKEVKKMELPPYPPKPKLKLIKVRQKEIGTYFVEENPEKLNAYCLHSEAKVGTMVTVVNPMNGRSMKIKCIGKLPRTGDGTAIRLTYSVARRLNLRDQRFELKCSYSKQVKY